MTLPDRILLQVEKPARYIGGEINMVEKDPARAEIRFALCFPDVYEVGMSHLGLSVLYYFMNRRDDTYCERAFAPWSDMERALRQNGLPLFALETGDPLSRFDILGFTLQYEMSYTNMVNMLELSGIAPLAANRGENAPIICAGGPCAYNPEPMANFVDFFYIGEAEAALDTVLDKYAANKRAGGSKREFLASLLGVDGIYVPCFYDVSYKASGELDRFTPNHPDAPPVVKRALHMDLDAAFCPDTQLVPLIQTVHDRVTLEVFRGCSRGCRFCQAGFVFRPVRERSAGALLSRAEKLVAATGHEEISLLSLSASDYSGFGELSQGLLERFQSERVNISLPSLRIDAFTLAVMEKAQGVRKSSLTFAPEAGSQRLRDVVNKGLTEEEILAGAALAFRGGWDRIKLYFMTGLPTETPEDLRGIADLTEKIISAYYAERSGKKNRSVCVNVSASCFVPKPFTPFQWEAQDTVESFREKQAAVKGAIRRKQARFTYHDPFVSVLEGVMARGDRRLSAVILKAWELGARFDAWSESFNGGAWLRAFAETGMDMAFYAHRERGEAELLPWDFIDVHVTKDFLLEERRRALSGRTTPGCRESCSLCGAQNLSGGVCVGC